MSTGIRAVGATVAADTAVSTVTPLVPDQPSDSKK
jgi:hypothetical protein